LILGDLKTVTKPACLLEKVYKQGGLNTFSLSGHNAATKRSEDSRVASRQQIKKIEMKRVGSSIAMRKA
jgi:hypothetical protein